MTDTLVGGFFDTLTSWVLNSVGWFLTAAGAVLTSASEPTTIIRSATTEFNVLVNLSPGLLMIGLLVATLQAVRHGDAGLESVNQLSSSASSSVLDRQAQLVGELGNVAAAAPAFALFVLAVAVVIGSWLLWCELIVRGVILTLLLVLVPVIVPLATFPAGRRLGWRLAETFLAVAVSKLLIVITLALGFDELLGDSATQVITGALTLILASSSPFLLLKVIPFVEAAALHNLEGVRSRLTKTVTNIPSSPVAQAVRAMKPDVPFTGPEERPEDLGLGMWEGGPETPMPESTGVKLPPPIGTPTPRGGHVAYRTDDKGPVVGWHFDE
ncbi:MAG: hypothetical protein ABSA22_12015 [Acidimicrobiales bacterium]